LLTEAQMCLRMDVRRALHRLAEDRRSIVWLIAVEDFSVEEVAEMRGCSHDTILREYRAGLSRIKARLRDDDRPRKRPRTKRP